MLASPKMHESCYETFPGTVFQRHECLVAGGQHCPVVKAEGGYLSVKKGTLNVRTSGRRYRKDHGGEGRTLNYLLGKNPPKIPQPTKTPKTNKLAVLCCND